MKKTVAVAKPAHRTWLEVVQMSFKNQEFDLSRPEGTGFPEVQITVPDNWPSVILAPWYDVHVGADEFDEKLFLKHRDWMAKTPNVISWLGGDIFENKTPHEGKMGHDKMSAEKQIESCTKLFAPVQHKIIGSLPGNHEDRTYKQAQMSSAKRFAENLQVEFFPDYIFALIKWRGNSFRLVAHHGAGGAATPGSQRNSARKELAWTKPDILWTGHVHQEMADVVYQQDYDQRTGLLYERNGVVVISPSYLKFYGGYGAKKRYTPGTRGIGVVELQEDGRIDVTLHARGKRL